MERKALTLTSSYSWAVRLEPLPSYPLCFPPSLSLTTHLESQGSEGGFQFPDVDRAFPVAVEEVKSLSDFLQLFLVQALYRRGNRK